MSLVNCLSTSSSKSSDRSDDSIVLVVLGLFTQIINRFESEALAIDIACSRALIEQSEKSIAARIVFISV
jgi:hypothetical protein